MRRPHRSSTPRRELYRFRRTPHLSPPVFVSTPSRDDDVQRMIVDFRPHVPHLFRIWHQLSAETRALLRCAFDRLDSGTAPGPRPNSTTLAGKLQVLVLTRPDDARRLVTTIDALLAHGGVS